MKKIIILLGILVILFTMSIPQISAWEWDNIKEFDNTEGKYGKIDIYNSIIPKLVKGDKLASYEVIFNTDFCYIECEAIMEVELFQDDRLFTNIYTNDVNGNIRELDELKLQVQTETDYSDPLYEETCDNFILGNDSTKSENCTQSQSGTFNYTRKDYVDYTGEIMPSGNYTIKVKARKQPRENVDWLVESLGHTLSEWLWFNSTYPNRRNITNMTETIAMPINHTNNLTSFNGTGMIIYGTGNSSNPDEMTALYYQNNATGDNVIANDTAEFWKVISYPHSVTTGSPPGQLTYFAPLDEGDSLSDYVGTFPDLTTVGSPTFGNASEMFFGYGFDSGDEGLAINGTSNPFANVGAGSVEIWYYPIGWGCDGNAANRWLFDNAGHFEQSFRFESSGVFAEFRLGSTTLFEVVCTTWGLDADQWNHLVLTWDNSSDNHTAYANGVIVHSSSTALGAVGVQDTIVFGQNTAGSESLDANISHIAFYDEVLSAEEIERLFGRRTGLAAEETDLVSVTVNVTFPTNNTFNTNVSALNYTFNNADDSCFFSTDNGATNSTPVSFGTNFTDVTSVEGTNNWTVWCNDTGGNEGGNSVVFLKDTVDPITNITFPENITYGMNISEMNYTYIDDNPGTCEFNSTLNVVAGAANFTGLESNEGFNSFNLTCNDTAGNSVFTQVNFTVDTIGPAVNQIIFPTNDTFYVNVTELNYTVTGTPAFCFFSTDFGVTNSSPVTAGINFTDVTSVVGGNNWTVYCNDSVGNEGNRIVNFTRLNLTAHLLEPANLTTLSVVIDLMFNSTASVLGYVDAFLVNISFYHNATGTFHRNQTLDLTNGTDLIVYDAIDDSEINDSLWTNNTDGGGSISEDSNRIRGVANTAIAGNVTVTLNSTALPRPFQINNLTINLNMSSTQGNAEAGSNSTVILRVFGHNIKIIEGTESNTSLWTFRKNLSVSFFTFDVFADDTLISQINATQPQISFQSRATIITADGGSNVPEFNLFDVEYSTHNFSSSVNASFIIDDFQNTTLWNIEACDNNNNCTFAQNNFTVIFNPDVTPPFVNITNPINDTLVRLGFTTQNLTNITLNWTVSDAIGLDTCFYSIDTGVTNNTVTCGDNGTVFEDGFQLYQFMFCANDTTGNINCTFAQVTYEALMSLVSLTFNTDVLETSNQRFELNVSIASDVTSVTSLFNYNNTVIDTPLVVCASGACTIESTIDIPLVIPGLITQNKSFIFNMTIFNSTDFTNVQSNSAQQNVSIISLGQCGGALTIIALNFTTYDEQNTSTRIDPYRFNGFFEFWLGNGTLVKNASVSNESADEVLICISPNATYFIDAQIDYDETNGSTNYTERSYFFQNDSVSDATQNISLFLLLEDFATSFIVLVQDQNILPIANYLVEMQRFYPGIGIFETVQIAKTGDNGKSVLFLEAEIADYRFLITFQNKLFLITSPPQKIVGESVPFTITFTVGEPAGTPWNPYKNVSDLTFSLVYNQTTQVVTYTFVDFSGNFTEGRLLVQAINQSGNNPTLCNIETTNASSTFSCNITGNSTGTYSATGFLTRDSSDEQIIIQITFNLETFQNTAGLLGVFFAMLIIIVAGMSFLFNEILGIWAINVAVIFSQMLMLINFGPVFITAMIAVSIIITIQLER